MDLCDSLNYLFGTEELVNLRRGLVLLREELENYQYKYIRCRIICSGSLGEGVAYPRSDDDLMYYPTFNRVVKSYREATQICDLLMVPSDSSPGYCMLHDVYHSCPTNLLHAMNEMPFLSSSLWRQCGLRNGESIHGPCRSQRYGPYEYDHAMCIQCPSWPDVANDWILRNRSHGWPSRELIHNILMNGCHVVPIGDQSSSYHEHEWRISFSIAERTLMHSFNHVQFLTYNLLRLCLKRVIGKLRSGVLCSYFMKTTLFYTAENTTLQFWQEGNIETCFKTCLFVLYDYVYHGYCPNYFIPEYNMIKQKVNHTNRQPLLDIIRSLHRIGIVGTLHLCGESFCIMDESISLPIVELKLDFECLSSHHLCFTVLSLVNFTSTHDTNEVLCKLLRLHQCYSDVKLVNSIFRSGILFYCQKLIDSLWHSLRINKGNYHLHKTIEPLLRIGYRANVTTGKLTAATYMYLIGKTESALSHIRRLLSEYPPYAIDGTSNVCTAAVYMDVMCGRGYTMDYKIRHAHAPPFCMPESFLNAFPLPLRILISTYSDFIAIAKEPLPYTYVLESLCYIRLQNYALLKKSTRCLVNVLDDLTNNEAILFTRMCIGIIKSEQYDDQSACRWLASAYVMKDSFEPIYSQCFSYSVITYIACFLNRRFRTDYHNA